jgi:hypothetical protein
MLGHLQPLDLGDGLLLNPSRAPDLHGLPDTERGGGRERNRCGHQDGGPAPGRLRGAGQLCVTRVELRPDRSRVRVPRRRILREASVHDGLHVTRDVGSHAANRRRLVAQDRRDGAQLCRADERPAAGQHLVEHGAERKDVGSRVDGAPFGLFGGHIGRGSHDQPGPRPQRRHRLFSGRALDELREAEVEDLRAAVARDHDVGRLDVAMDDAVGMRRGERGGHLRAVLERCRHWQRALGDDPIERRAFNQLHRDERRAGVLVDVVDRDDVRVVEGGGRARLLHEPPVAIGVGCRLRRQHLDGDRPAEARIDRAVHDTHPAPADLRFDTVV